MDKCCINLVRLVVGLQLKLLQPLTNNAETRSWGQGSCVVVLVWWAAGGWREVSNLIIIFLESLWGEMCHMPKSDPNSGLKNVHF